jgi:hypothetical protein
MKPHFAVSLGRRRALDGLRLRFPKRVKRAKRVTASSRSSSVAAGPATAPSSDPTN